MSKLAITFPFVLRLISNVCLSLHCDHLVGALHFHFLYTALQPFLLVECVLKGSRLVTVREEYQHGVLLIQVDLFERNAWPRLHTVDRASARNLFFRDN